MKISKAFCEQSRSVINIYQAKEVYFSKENNKQDLVFLCSDTRCRNLQIPTKISGVNYRVLFLEENKFKAPHFKNTPYNKHHAECVWKQDEVVKEIIKDAILLGDIDEDELPNRFQRIGQSKNNDVIDLFFLDEEEIEELIVEVEIDQVGSKGVTIKGVSEINGQTKRVYKLAALKSSVLHELVTCFHSLKIDERKGMSLKIGKQGVKRSYSQCFIPMKYINDKSNTKDLIFYGGCSVVKAYGKQDDPKSFLIKFYDKISLNEKKDIQFYLQVDKIRDLPYGNMYLDYLLKASAEPLNYYLKIYMFLPLVDRFKEKKEYNWCVNIDLPSYRHIDISLIDKNKK